MAWISCASRSTTYQLYCAYDPGAKYALSSKPMRTMDTPRAMAPARKSQLSRP